MSYPRSHNKCDMNMWYEPRLFNSRNTFITSADLFYASGSLTYFSSLSVLNSSVLLDIWKTCYCLVKGIKSQKGYKPQFASWLYYAHRHPVNYNSLYQTPSSAFLAKSIVFHKSTWYIADVIGLYSNYHFIYFVLSCCWFLFLLEEPSSKSSLHCWPRSLS